MNSLLRSVLLVPLMAGPQSTEATVLIENSESPESTVRAAPTTDAAPGIDRNLLLGTWLGDKYIIFYPDGRYGLQKYEGAPIDDKDRSWKLKGNQITWDALGEVFTETIVTLTAKKLVIKDGEGNLETYTRAAE